MRMNGRTEELFEHNDTAAFQAVSNGRMPF